VNLEFFCLNSRSRYCRNRSYKESLQAILSWSFW